MTTHPFALEWSAVNVRLGITAGVFVLLLIVLGWLIGLPGFVAALSAVLALVGTLGWSTELRLRGLLFFACTSIIILVLCVLVNMIALDWVTTLLIFGVTWACTLPMAAGAQAAQLGLMLNVWLLIALVLPVEVPLWQPVLGLLLGVSVIMGNIWFAARRQEAAPETTTTLTSSDIWSSIRESLDWQSSVLQFALLRAAAVALAFFIEATFFETRPLWAATTALVIMRPAFDQTLVVGIQRAVGTLVGVFVGMWLIANAQHPVLLLVLLLGVAFGMGATVAVNYAVFVVFLTLVLLVFSRALGADILDVGLDRILATGVGVIMALIMIVFVRHYAQPEQELQ